MPQPIQSGRRTRLSFSKIEEIEELPDLIEIQKRSYEEFLQRRTQPENRKNVGLQAVFDEIFPITDFNNTATLEFVGYTLGDPKYDIAECQSRGFSYAVPMKIRVRLISYEVEKSTGDRTQIGEIKESEIYMGEMPLMTEGGTFIINGSERVIVSQLHRSPGSSFGESKHSSGHKLLNAKVIPYRGAWMEFEYDIKDMIYVRLDRKKKMFVTVLLRALGWETDEEILKLFAETERISLSISDEDLIGRVIASDVVNFETGEILVQANTLIDDTLLATVREEGIANVEVVKSEDADRIRYLRNTLARDNETANYHPDRIHDQALIDIFRKLQPGNPPSIDSAKSRFEKLFFDPTRYDLEDVGRYKLNQKLSNIALYRCAYRCFVGQILKEDLVDDKKEVIAEASTEITLEIWRRLKPVIFKPSNIGETITADLYDAHGKQIASTGEMVTQELIDSLMPTQEERTLRVCDILSTIEYLTRLQSKHETDDIDHLGNRRVRAVGELLMNQVRAGLHRVSRATREKMTISSKTESATVSEMINPKPLSAAIKDFFGSSQLSQFMQQINPLDELTHKRRLSALGPGGLRRERATFDVRDVHRTHYGRVCPIETPEGPSVGLIVSLGTYARMNEYGFLETPYRKVENGRVTNQIDYLTADQEDNFVIAQANTPIDENYNLADDVMARSRGEYLRKGSSEVDYIDVSPKQIVGVSASLIPFLEHDDANRALMGSNMQRQAVPLIDPNAPFVGTGMEAKAAHDSGAIVLAKHDGFVDRVSASQIIIRTEDTSWIEDGETSSSEMGYDIYHLQNFKRTNNATCSHQRPCVKVGEKIREGQVIADGASTDNGELALGANLLVAFMPWEGYNFEDAILLSEMLVQDDVLTSIHIDEFEVEARDTKMGREEITDDIPNLQPEKLSQLDDEGIIRVGSVVAPGSILVGKVTPKADNDLGPEEKLLRAIFGEKVAEFKDASKYAKPGVEGVVIDVKVFSRKERDKDRASELREDAKVKEIELEWKRKCDLIRHRRNLEIRRALIDQALAEPVYDGKEIIAHAEDLITEDLFDQVSPAMIDLFEVKSREVRSACTQIRKLANARINAHTLEKEQMIEKLRKGDELKPGVVKLVKVYVATRRKVAVGDKMAGRHGNKGVVSKILPREDMPYLEDGTPVDIILNPLGVPSRMNVGQVLETHIGWAAQKLGVHIATPVFDGATEKEISDLLDQAKLPNSGKTRLYDGRTGESFHQEVTVGYAYMMKLNHLVDDKLHARSTGPYSLVTQQPLGGKAQQGGQRLGEMEVWALEAYGAAYTLQELLTIKSDDVSGRSKIYEAIVKGDNAPPPGTPESFNVLIKELQSLCLDVDLEEKEETRQISR